MISVFTPTHNTKYLRDAYKSLCDQKYEDWEWVVVPNNGARIPQEIRDDKRVKIFPLKSSSVGELKAFACSKATGELLVELDHDDLLTPDCLFELSLSDEDFIYSNGIQVDQDWKPVTWMKTNGWEDRPVTYEGHDCLEVISPEPSPSNFSRIWFAPNHVRAWRKEFYDRIGGHNPELPVGDDHELMCRTYLEGSIEHIDKPLYVYRIHDDNSWKKQSDDIQAIMWGNHHRYFVPMQERWSRAFGHRLIDLGGAIDSPEGYESYDRHNADIIGNLNEDWDLEDSSVGLLRAHDIVEHLVDPVHTMNEAYRVLTHGGALDILVPSTAGVGAWCDPTHVSFWNIRSFRYYTEQGMRQYLEPECKAKFQVVCLQECLMWEGIPYVTAQLLAIKEGPRYHGPLHWDEVN